MRYFQEKPLLCLLTSLWLVVSCTPSIVDPPPPPRAFGSAQVSSSLQATAALVNVTEVRLTLSASDIPERTVSLAKTGGQWGGVIGQIPTGTNRTFSAMALDASGTARFKGQATGITILANQTVVVVITLQQLEPPPVFENAAPCITSLTSSSSSVRPGGSVSLVATAEDVDEGDTLTYTWTASAGSFGASDSPSTTWTAPSEVGPATLTLTVTDSKGAVTAVSLTISVRTNQGSASAVISFNTWPAVTRVLATPTAIEVGQTTTVTASVGDEDGDALAYHWEAGCAGSWTDATLATARFTPSEQPESGTCANCPLTVTVSDGRGGQGSGTLSICVGRRTQARFPPEIVSTFQSSASAPAGAVITFQVGAEDPQGSPLSFAWRANVGTLGTPNHTATGSEVLWTAPECVLSGHTPTIQLTVTNGLGLFTTTQFTLSGAPPCSDLVCEGGRVDCGGVCSDLSTDTAHCGGCNQACRTGETCSSGACACAAGMVDCGDVCAGLDNDPMNCGACGRRCPSGASCEGGTCVASCTDGKTSCEGYCVDLRNDAANCGACGLTCGTGATCAGGICQCAPGEALCNGICRDTQSDTTNCGGCGVTCRADQTCSSGQCVCPTGNTICGGLCVDTQSDNLNCGACGTRCGSSNVCVEGRCINPFTCQQNFTAAPSDCSAFPLNLDSCGAAGAPFSVGTLEDKNFSSTYILPLIVAPNEWLRIHGSATSNDSSGDNLYLGFYTEAFPDVVLAENGYAVYPTGKELYLETVSSPYACARPGLLKIRAATTPSINYNLQFERYLLSGNHNTGGTSQATATQLAINEGGRVCDQICGRLKAFCATGEDRHQYYRLTLPPKRAAIVDAGLRGFGGSGAGVTLKAIRGDGDFICDLFGVVAGNDTNFTRARLVNNTLVPQDVILMITTSFNASDYNLSIAIEP